MTAIGRRLGEGRTAEVFAYGEGEAIKLLRPGFPERYLEHEAVLATRVATVYPGAPRCAGLVRVDGRLGLRFERIDGVAMEDRLASRPWQLGRLARTFGELQARMHTSDGTGLPDQRAAILDAIDRAADHLPPGAAEAARHAIDLLPNGSAVCHGDLHPGNVLLGARPAVIDWDNARRGSPEADVARSLYLLIDTPMGLPGHPVLARIARFARQRFAARALVSYRSRRPLDLALVAAWRLPILAARLAEGIELERAYLVGEIEAAVASAAPHGGAPGGSAPHGDAGVTRRR
ncbi:MAG TPA: phosphotransferase [Candidatus Limnocylindrales bacterium]